MPTTIDQQFIEYIVKSLVGNPDAVSIERRIDEKGVLLELTVDPEDLGRVIGKRGGTAQSLRTLLRALGTKNDARYNLKIVDNDGPRPERSQDQQDNTSNNDDTNHNDGTEDASTVVADQPSNDDTSSSIQQDDNPVEETTDEPVDDSSEKAKQHRKDLADLDDLDI